MRNAVLNNAVSVVVGVWLCGMAWGQEAEIFSIRVPGSDQATVTNVMGDLNGVPDADSNLDGDRDHARTTAAIAINQGAELLQAYAIADAQANVAPGVSTLAPTVEALTIDAFAIVGLTRDPVATGNAACLASAVGTGTYVVSTDANGVPPVDEATMFAALYVATIGDSIGNATATANSRLRVAVGSSSVTADFIGPGAGWTISLVLQRRTELDPTAAAFEDVLIVQDDDLNNQFDASELVVEGTDVVIETRAENCGANGTINDANPNTAMLWRAWLAAGWYFVSDLIEG
jgi:hypothetical protein